MKIVYIPGITLLVLILTIVISYKCCGQVAVPSQVSNCNLLVLEKEIDDFEKNTYNPNPKNRISIWDTSECRRPSVLIDPNTCKTRVLSEGYVPCIMNLRIKAEENFEQGEALRNSSKPNIIGNKPPETGQINKPSSPSPTRYNPQINIETLPRGSFYCFNSRPDEKQYTFVLLDPAAKDYSVDFLWKDSESRIFGSFSNALGYLRFHDKNPVMLMNAGIFDINQAPLGLFYSNTKRMRGLNIGTGPGNFYLQPNGVFLIEKMGKAKVMTKAEFLKNKADTVNIKNATQSGPMLVIDGHINDQFTEKSANLSIRNGVGVMPDGRIVFIISKEAINFYDFAQMFKEFECENALYLDGTISKMYLPGLKMKDIGGNFAGMIAIYKK